MSTHLCQNCGALTGFPEPPVSEVGEVVAFLRHYSPLAPRAGERGNIVKAADMLERYAAALREIQGRYLHDSDIYRIVEDALHPSA